MRRECPHMSDAFLNTRSGRAVRLCIVTRKGRPGRIAHTAHMYYDLLTGKKVPIAKIDLGRSLTEMEVLALAGNPMPLPDPPREIGSFLQVEGSEQIVEYLGYKLRPRGMPMVLHTCRDVLTGEIVKLANIQIGEPLTEMEVLGHVSKES